MTLTLRSFLFSAIALASLAAVPAAEDAQKAKPKAHAMVYMPTRGVIWDPSVLWHDGRYYMFSMYWPAKAGFESVWLATSVDGVHWQDYGEVIPRPRAKSPCNQVYKCFVGRCGDRFIMDFGAFSGKPGTERQDTLCFYESHDLLHWTYVGESRVDSRWYVDKAAGGRWDHMYMLPKEEGNPRAGYWGWVVANPKPAERAQNRAFGMMESADGLHWNAMQPPLAELGGRDPISPGLAYETGGAERIGCKYYLLAGTYGYLRQMSYAMFTFTSDNPRGPFKLDPTAWRLCGASQAHPPLPTGTGVQQLACWVRGNGELLISNYLTWGNIVLLPLRKPVVDADGHLRLGYWKNNDAAKGRPLALNMDQCEQVFPREPRLLVTDARSVRLKAEGTDPVVRSRAAALLRQAFDLEQGVILEGTIEVAAGRNRPCCAGFYLEAKQGEGTGIALEASDAALRCSYVGALKLGKQWDFHSCDETGPGCATVTGIVPGRKHTFRLWLHHNIFELYIDDLLMQTMAVGERTGRVGFLVQNGVATVTDLKAWSMNL
jgi:hypothetical protein